MKIVILGAGVTGSSVATALASEENDIVVIDTKTHLLANLKERLDIATVTGNAGHPSILEQAGVQNADIVIAVTDQDETNMLACQIINTLYSKPKTIARVRAIDYLKHPELFRPGGIPIDIVISPEQIVMQAIHNLIKFPGVKHISSFANGMVRLFSIKAATQGFLTERRIKDLKERLTSGKIRVVAIFREGEPILVNGEAIIKEGDEVFFVSPREKIRKVLTELHTLEEPIKTVMIAGGGHVGKRLAMALENEHQVKVIEQDLNRIKNISVDLKKTTLLHGDSTDENLLLDEMIEKTDLFCAVTNNDGANIISAALAKKLGAKKAICLLNHSAYVKLVEETNIDVVVLPNQETLGSILKHVRKGDVARVSSLCGGTAEALEAVAHKDGAMRSVVGLTVEQVKLPEGVVLGSLIRLGKIIPIHHDTVFEESDHIVMFALDKMLIKYIEGYFQRL
ncbi:potassium transporter peripheral membrane component [Methyloprofundus sedimenti]|uniref:Trk system potassium uptake protein TrkA n=1 Tax=Methyloprofundus sedimenti TaxID=1420851 RepID=A0A1V8M4X3_9GAMM|nr:Trk system potassium transporter TrkA [Methyloprofundus sedimenti]OQK16568.1 potassium transporter peripheral membrane component [Methyloprofundus sedimenti]